MDKETVIRLAEAAGFYYHKEYVHASFAPGGRSTKPEGFKYGLEEIPYAIISELIYSAITSERDELKRIVEESRKQKPYCTKGDVHSSLVFMSMNEARQPLYAAPVIKEP